ncbi:hypothetical protein GW17_00053090 [Ensete ventricosum]|nr:hypothetical protein GW17_00053090 [Ensete ventricosum]
MKAEHRLENAQSALPRTRLRRKAADAEERRLSRGSLRLEGSPKNIFEDEAEVQGYCGLGPRVVPSVVEDKVKAQGYCSLGPWVVPNTIVDEAKAHGHCNLGPWAIPSTTEYETKAQGHCNLGPWVVLSPWAIIGTVKDEAKAHTKGAEEPMRVVVDAPVMLGSHCWTSSSLWRAVSPFWSDCSTPCCMGSYPL